MNEFLNMATKILNIEISEYSLKPKYILNSKLKTTNIRQGFLLRILFKDIGQGYSDLFAWPELGDTPIREQILNLKHKNYNSHLQKSIYFAYFDAMYREKKQNIFHNVTIPKNHFTCADIKVLSNDFIENLKEQGFSKIKLKCGHNIHEVETIIKSFYSILNNLNMKLRLDFNSSCDLQSIISFLNNLKEFLNIIDFIEDPIPYSNDNWRSIKNNFVNIKLAFDNFNHINLIHNDNKNLIISDALIFKPAVQELSNIPINFLIENGKQLIFTSYMDHPLGQLCALFEASLCYSKNLQMMNECGFLTHTLYDNNCYSETFSIMNTKLLPSLEGYGFGFDEVLVKECWRNIE